MNKERDNLIAALEEASRESGVGNPILISPMFWSDMRWHMLNRDSDLSEETSIESLDARHIGTWRGHKLYLDLKAATPKAKK